MASRGKALITGITGQDGSYVAEIMAERGWEVHGLVRRVAARSQRERLSRIWHLLERGAVTVHDGDVTIRDSVVNVFQRVKPDRVFHLAAQSHVGRSFGDPATTFRNNVHGTEIILDSFRRLAPEARLYFAGSSEQFGDSPPPQNEATPQRPVSPYGESKREAWEACGRAREAGLWLARGIAFNHESPRRGDEFVTQKIVSGCVRIARGQVTPFSLGNLAPRRDWGHAHDYARAFCDMLELDRPTDLVLGTGMSWSVSEWLVRVCEELCLEPDDCHDLDPAFLRTNEIDELRADPALAREALRWDPFFSFGDLVREMVNAELARQRGDVAWEETLSPNSAPSPTTR